MALQFYNSLTRNVEAFQPLQTGKAGMYTCGPTVYDYAHIGNFRAYIFEDILRRTLRYCGYSVYQVMNLTDVDDKTIRNATETGISLNECTRPYKQAFFEDLDTLRIQRAEQYPEATGHIEDMVSLVKKLVEKEYAYQAEDGSVYFSIERFPEYGKLSRVDPDMLQSGKRIKNDEYAKESVADFALWKAWEESDGDVWWDSPWGPGRPGWHVECSAMSMRYLGPTFDIHTGGIDNMFPHHEDEIAQSEAANGCRFVNTWLHCAHLVVEGEKMAKSAGNFYTLRDLLNHGYTGREIRWVLLGTHYRQPLNFTFQGLHDARTALQRVDEFSDRLQKNSAEHTVGEKPMETLVQQTRGNFLAALEDDLNISGAIGVLFEFIREVNRELDAGRISGKPLEQGLRLLAEFDEVVGCLQSDKDADSVPETIRELLEKRQQARQQKDYAEADAIRDRIQAEGWLVEDTSEGPRVKRA